MRDLATSRLITLPSGQVIGHPVTRRELKRQLRQSRLRRRLGMRMLKQAGFTYAEINTKATR